MTFRIAFVDDFSQRPYDPHVLAAEALGGSESSAVRVAEGLGAYGDGPESVTFLQAQRRELARFGATYAPATEDGLRREWDAVVVLRRPSTLAWVRRALPDTPLFLWSQDLPGDHLKHPALVDASPTLITVSEFHRASVEDALRKAHPGVRFNIQRVYNPVDDDLLPDDQPFDRNQLVFVSSPHKGLRETVAAFLVVRSIHPQTRLEICNPGYLKFQVDRTPPGVNYRGSLPHAEAVDLMRSSLGVFYPNVTYPETFGLIYAEANAVGTPVLAHDFGAASEVLQNRQQLLDARNHRDVAERITAWIRGERPTVGLADCFRTRAVIQEWVAVLGLG